MPGRGELRRAKRLYVHPATVPPPALSLMVKLVDEMFARYVRTQDADALAFVFEQTAPALARRARRLLGDARAAEDLVQDLFLSLLTGAVAWDASRPCRPWLVG